MKKIIILALLFTIVVLGKSRIEVKAYDFLPYWYSDSNWASKFDTDTVYFYYHNWDGNCNMTSADIIDYVD